MNTERLKDFPWHEMFFYHATSRDLARRIVDEGFDALPIGSYVFRNCRQDATSIAKGCGFKNILVVRLHLENPMIVTQEEFLDSDLDLVNEEWFMERGIDAMLVLHQEGILNTTARVARKSAIEIVSLLTTGLADSTI